MKKLNRHNQCMTLGKTKLQANEIELLTYQQNRRGKK